jgi:hypothetical protein
MGVAEHIFDVDIHGKSVTWHLFDVGGARGQRHSWVPYFDDANAIIFVAPISAFDQVCFASPLSYPTSKSSHGSFFLSTWRKTRGRTESTTHFSCLRKSALTPS